MKRQSTGRQCPVLSGHWPTAFSATIAGKLGEAGLLTCEAPKENKGFRRLIVEKPFGHDLASAKALNKCLPVEMA